MSPAVFHGSATYPIEGPAPVVTIGNFDGVHLGHQSLIARAKALAEELSAPVCALTFHPAPRDVLRPENPVPRIQSLDDRIDSLGAAGIEQVVVERFTRSLASESARWFADEILVRRLRSRGLALGWDFRFGQGRQGTVDALRQWLPIPVVQVSPFQAAGQVISSSRIRQLVRHGQVEEAAALLSRPHRLRGPVVRGDRRGRTLGFPTANVQIQTSLRPAPGVYAVQFEAYGITRAGVANYGTRPTFGDGDPILEVHVLDYQGDLYGAQVAVDLIARLREERRFASADDLQAQIHLDVQAARERLG